VGLRTVSRQRDTLAQVPELSLAVGGGNHSMVALPIHTAKIR
jgi:hypothetical protein